MLFFTKNEAFEIDPVWYYSIHLSTYSKRLNKKKIFKNKLEKSVSNMLGEVYSWPYLKFYRLTILASAYFTIKIFKRSGIH